MSSPVGSSGSPLLEVRADLDVPGETGRQVRVLFVWLLCLALAVVGGVLARAHVSASDELSPAVAAEIARSRRDRLKIAALVGLLTPALLTWLLNHRYRRGGAHARGIVVDVTHAGELRIWGRGYGTRVSLADAEIGERLVDVYAGRLGAWRQRRLKVRAARAPELELATPAIAADLEDGLRVDGGEGTCVELTREDYERLRRCVQDAKRMAS